jgi:ribonuclease E
MDLEELRLNCLRMAHELGGKSEAVISAANDLLSFVMNGPAAGTHALAPEPATTKEAPSEVSEPAAEPAVTDRIAACGTALEMPEGGDLAQAEPVVEVEAAAEAEPAAPVEVTEAATSEAAAEEAEAISEPVAAVEETEPSSAPSPEPAEELAEAASNGSADAEAAPEVEPAAAAAEPVASEEAAIPSEDEAVAVAPAADGSAPEHTAN